MTRKLSIPAIWLVMLLTVTGVGFFTAALTTSIDPNNLAPRLVTLSSGLLMLSALVLCVSAGLRAVSLYLGVALAFLAVSVAML